ncbi:hypothetical protein KIL84_002167 [Mauremys mutica]|uniref:Methyl-CpG-binding domain protein 1 n=1 Tax=Mauremys mutica TaxID=74926 RepID=A0A9D3XJU0_9SAUR|nr:hypothetical protein KIL84_002167 [Mauremys mutica]
MALNGHAELAGFLSPAGSSLVGDARADRPSAEERGMLGPGACGRIQDQSLSSVSHAPRGCCLVAAPCARREEGVVDGHAFIAALLPLPQLGTMSEGWVDCPTLGPGWKRREAYRRSGATCGRTDTYYQGPNGEKFRSKIELTRFLGPSQDLTNFDFKNGVLREPPPKECAEPCLAGAEGGCSQPTLVGDFSRARGSGRNSGRLRSVRVRLTRGTNRPWPQAAMGNSYGWRLSDPEMKAKD